MVEMNEIRISLCIPGYNRPNFLKKTLASIINQTRKPYEVIVMDDASTDDMFNIEKTCRENGFQYIKNEKNVGLMKNFNNAISFATGNYLAIVHNDDLLSKFYIEEVERFICKYPHYNVYVTNGIGINKRNEAVGEYRLFRKDTVIKKKEGIKKLWAKDYFCILSVIGCTIYDTRFIQTHPLDVRLGNEADLDKALQLLKEEDVMYIDKPIYFTTLHDDQVSYKNKLSDEQLMAYIQNRLHILKKFEKDFNDIPFYLSKIKALHFLQLFIKYRYGVERLIKNLEIKKIDELFLIFLLIPSLIYKTILKKILFLIYKKNISYYLS